MTRHTSIAFAALLVLSLSACAVRDARKEQVGDIQRARAEASGAPESRPVVQTHASNWLLGEEIVASKPQPPIFDKQISYAYQAGSLGDLASWVTRHTGIPTIVDSSASDNSAVRPPTAAPAALPASPPVAFPRRSWS